MKYFNEIKRLKSLQKAEVYLEPKRRSNDGAFLWIYLTAYYLRNISSIIDFRLGYVWVSENIENLKVKLSWSKSLRLLQRVAFLDLFGFFDITGWKKARPEVIFINITFSMWPPLPEKRVGCKRQSDKIIESFAVA